MSDEEKQAWDNLQQACETLRDEIFKALRIYQIAEAFNTWLSRF